MFVHNEKTVSSQSMVIHYLSQPLSQSHPLLKDQDSREKTRHDHRLTTNKQTTKQVFKSVQCSSWFD